MFYKLYLEIKNGQNGFVINRITLLKDAIISAYKLSSKITNGATYYKSQFFATVYTTTFNIVAINLNFLAGQN